MLITINANVSGDLLQFEGADVVDYSVNEGWVQIDVEESEIDAEFLVNGGLYPIEVWGAITYQEELSIDIKHCCWNGYDIENEEEICWQLWKLENL